MSVVSSAPFASDNSFARELEGLYRPWQSAPAPDAQPLVVNTPLAAELGVDTDALVAALRDGVSGIAQAYAGHQFGTYNPQLGDGRALLLGEVVDASGQRHDIHLKGSGRTPFSRGGDGKAAVGPMLREHLVSEAMHAVGIPTTRSLAVVATGERVRRETSLPGAILVRVAASHLRVGTFQYASASGDRDLLRRLADYAIARHHPAAAEAERPYLALFEHVVEAQSALIARWMLAGFIHGVMNTDNMTISGETIDYGPCAFMDAFDPGTVFSSIDHLRRYAYGNQPGIAQWNLARLAESLLPLMHEEIETALELATETLHRFPDRYLVHWNAGMRAKLGGASDELADALPALLHAEGLDFTSFFRTLSASLRGDALVPPLGDWSERWRAELTGDPAATADAMDRVNPVYIPRNHLVEEALAAATAGDLGPFEQLHQVLARPFDARPGLERYAEPAEPDPAYRTFCGT